MVAESLGPQLVSRLKDLKISPRPTPSLGNVSLKMFDETQKVPTT